MTAVQKSHVPTRIIKRYLAAYMSKYPDMTLQELAWRADIPDRRLWAIMYEEQESVQFNTADKILLNLGYQMAWYEDPELEQYWLAA